MRILLVPFALSLSFNAFAGDLKTVSEQLAQSNDLASLYSCSLALGLMSKSLEAEGTEPVEHIDSVAKINDRFGEALDLKGEAVGNVDLSKFVPDWLSKSESPGEMLRGNLSEFKYCSALYKIAVLERTVDYLEVDIK